MSELVVKQTDIPGLVIVETAKQVNPGGWFTENWHQEKMRAAGAPELTPVQHNITHVQTRGLTRGFHAEPWDRYISVITGRAYGAWVDLRDGESYGRTAVHELVPGTSVFVPGGVGNAHQVLEDGTTFSYLMAEHWTHEASQRTQTANLFDPALNIKLPIAREDAILSERDLHAPYISDMIGRPRERGSMFRRAADRRSAVPATSGPGERGPFQVLFVCTANICRSAYADVVARSWDVDGVEFSSAGTHALVGQPIDPPIGSLVPDGADGTAHRARQLTRELVEAADIIVTMGSEHRRYILDEWPSAARKTFVIGHAAREIRGMADDARREDVADHLWHNRKTGPRDEVADPYRRGHGAALTAAQSIDTHLDDIIPTLKAMAARRA